MIDALAHRGQDYRGVWCEGSIGLAQRAHHLTSESRRERQPMGGSRSPVVLVADARIDNWKELAAALSLAPTPRPTSAELILAAYARWGSDCAQKLCGDFAFAIWDPISRSVFCARDAMGVRPFYYAHSRRRFAFASEIKALLTLDDVSQELDPETIALFVEGDTDDRARTMYADVQRLPAGHTMRVDAQSYAQSRYWRLETVSETRLADERDYADAVREIFAEAVSCRLVSDYPVAAALSGGLDSSSVVCMARELLARESAPASLHTLSLIFPELPANDLRLIDERPYIGAVVRGGGVEAHDVRGDRLTPLSDLKTLLAQLDEPFAAPNLYLHRGMYAAAQAHGARIFLDGFDGDSAMSHGFGRLESLARAGEWDGFEAEVRRYATNRGMAPSNVLPHFGLPQLAELAREGNWSAWTRAARELTRRFALSRRTIGVDYGLRPLLPASLSARWRALRGRGERTLLRPELARRVNERRAKRRRQAPGAGTSERALHVECVSQALYQSTLELADRTAASYGLEPRYPFFDRRLIEFCVSLPDEQKFANGWSRYHLRRAMTGVLPAEVQWRSTKGNLSPNFFRAFRLTDRSIVEQLPFSALEPYLDLSLVEALRQRESLASPSSPDNDGLVLFRLSVLATWLTERTRPGGVQSRPLAPRGIPVAQTRAPLAHTATASAVVPTSHQE